ncbi:VOC family protein [Actinacidiphila sp. bgisy144]|uniref:VOC family protein n=2 Tax=Streptomycetaceae TaxID=2062 RepID=UPI003EBDBE8B
MPSFSIRMDHVRLDVTDVARSAAFYAAALHLEQVVRYELDRRTILQMAPAGMPAGVELWQEDGLLPAPHPSQHLAFSVDDVPGIVAHVRALGYQIVEEPRRIGGETVAFLSDPDGHLIEINDFRGRGVAEAGRAPDSSSSSKVVE